MARLSKSDAARTIGVTRQTLYRYLTQGRISASPDGTIDTAELLRAGFELHNVTSTSDVTPERHIIHDVTSSVTPPVTPVTPAGETALLHQMIALLQREVEESRERERAAREREALLLHMLDQAQQQSQRLLDMPRGPATGGGVRVHREERYTTTALDTRCRILAYMQEHPGPHRPGEVAEALALQLTPRYVMNRMVERGVLKRVAPGVYVRAEESAQ